MVIPDGSNQSNMCWLKKTNTKDGVWQKTKVSKVAVLFFLFIFVKLLKNQINHKILETLCGKNL